MAQMTPLRRRMIDDMTGCAAPGGRFTAYAAGHI